MLAYSSIENIGIIMIGLGLALLGRSHNQPIWILLGMGGALLHVWNHSLFKSLLFFNAGAIIHACHTRNIDRMGGLAKANAAGYASVCHRGCRHLRPAAAERLCKANG
jgi:hydrogenase-4 component B